MLYLITMRSCMDSASGGLNGKLGGAQFRYDATVGGQIPIITLLQDLLQTGDRIESLHPGL